MVNFFLVAAALGAAVVSASPAPAAWQPVHGYQPTASRSWSASHPGQTPFSFPLANGFPNVSADALKAIEIAAHGSLPNGPLPTSLAPGTITTLEVIAFNEAFETAFFSSLLYNITHNVEGFGIESRSLRQFVINDITAVLAQEELHFLGANGILASAGQTPIQPCEYIFPTDNFDDAIALASKFTDVVLGTLQDALNTFATDGDFELVPLIGSIIGQEGEQNGYYRSLENFNPSAAPFLTRSVGQFAFSALNQDFVVPGTCPNIDLIHVPIFGVLSLDTTEIKNANQDLQFSFAKGDLTSIDDLSIVFINDQNLPVVEPLKNISYSKDGSIVNFSAYFAAGDLIAEGLTIAVITTSDGPFASVPDVAKVTLFGPALIENQ